MIDSYISQRETASVDSSPSSLSPREREFLSLVVAGKSNNEIADILSLSPDTVKTYRSRMMKKLGIDDMLGLVKFAVQHGLITLD